MGGPSGEASRSQLGRTGLPGPPRDRGAAPCVGGASSFRVNPRGSGALNRKWRRAPYHSAIPRAREAAEGRSAGASRPNAARWRCRGARKGAHLLQLGLAVRLGLLYKLLVVVVRNERARATDGDQWRHRDGAHEVAALCAAWRGPGGDAAG